MQRLFSTFADGWPGAGLLMQRLLLGAALEYCVVAAPSGTVAAPQVIGALAGVLLIAGLWTPVAGVVTACAEAWVPFSSPARAGIPAVLAVLGVTLALLGPASGRSMPGFTAESISSLPGSSSVAPDARIARGASPCPFV